MRTFIHGLALMLPLLALACQSPQAVAPSATSGALAPAKVDADALCGKDESGSVTRMVAARGSMLLFGEMHGTTETPRVVGNVLCRTLAGGTAVVLGLEIPPDEQATLDRYVASKGTDTDRAALLHGAFWQRPDKEQDGRSSAAMRDLVERVRLLRENGRDVKIAAFDAGGDEDQKRDTAMAERILAVRKALPRTTAMITLSGNIHARTTNGTPWNAAFIPMGKTIADATPAIGIDMLATAAWVCQDDNPCGPVTFERDRGDKPKFEIFERPSAVGGYRAAFNPGHTTPSPPAKATPAARGGSGR